MKLLEERKKKLAARGLFDEARKQLLPFMPEVIGVVTSPTGAVIRDILHRLADRFPRRVLVWPVRVQGETSAAEVANAIAGFNALPERGKLPRPDLIIVARGGGSLEDLWSFNEEIVVRAAADSMIPLISAVGHETDFTLIDFAADWRAPTPTAAAERAVPVRSELMATLGDLGQRKLACWQRGLDQRRKELRLLSRSLPALDQLLSAPRQRLDACSARLPRALIANAQIHHRQLTRVSAQLSPRLLIQRVERGRERTAALGARSSRAMLTLLDQRAAPSRTRRAPARCLLLPRRAQARLCAGPRWRGAATARGCLRRCGDATRHRIFRRPRRRGGARRGSHAPVAVGASAAPPRRRRRRGAGQLVRLAELFRQADEKPAARPILRREHADAAAVADQIDAVEYVDDIETRRELARRQAA